MANNPYVNKVETADGTTLIDITDTTAEAEDVESGRVFYAASGARTVGTGTGGGSGKLDQVAAYELYDSTATYDVGEVRAYNSRLWECSTQISTPEEWTESHWTETSIDEQKADRADVEELSNVCVEFDVTIATTDWSSSSPYTYTWYNNAVGANSKVVVLLNDGAEAAGIDDFTYDKVTGGVQFTTDELPVGNLPLHIQIVEVVEMESYDIDIPVTIAVSDWSNTSPYSYTYTDARITDGCSVEVYFADGAENCDVRLLDYAKGTNSVTITADVLPAQSLPVIIHIENMDSTGVAPLTASEVSTDAVTGQTTVQGALGALVNDKADKVSGGTPGNVAKLDSNGGIADSGYTIETSVPSNAVFTDTVTEVLNVLNSDSTTSALSAAQGKALNSKLDSLTIYTGITTLNLQTGARLATIYSAMEYPSVAYLLASDVAEQDRVGTAATYSSGYIKIEKRTSARSRIYYIHKTNTDYDYEMAIDSNNVPTGTWILNSVSALNSKKSNYIRLDTTETTWELIYAKLNELSSGETATITIESIQYGILSSGARSAKLYGTVSKRSASEFSFMLKGNSNVAYISKITGVSSSSAGTYSEEEFALNSKMSNIGTVTTGTTDTLTVPSATYTTIRSLTIGKGTFVVCGGFEFSSSFTDTVVGRLLMNNSAIYGTYVRGDGNGGGGMNISCIVESSTDQTTIALSVYQGSSSSKTISSLQLKAVRISA